ncbi:MAG: aldo/keto reductase [Myxococcales bacterium]|nr:aldo/keto reductase [Myxococcales bacterium]
MNHTLRALGSSDRRIHALGLGCMGMSDFYGGREDKASSIRVIHRALELGMTMVDTADIYGREGANEYLVGEALRAHREQALLATKFGIQRDAGGAFLGVCGRPEYVQQACEASLKRLGVEVIDLYYQHRYDPEVPIEETVGAMSQLITQGKVRHLGLSEVGPTTLKRAHATHPITAVQSELSLWTRDFESTVVPLCAELGVSFVAYSPLGRGFLTGKIQSVSELEPTDWRVGSPRMQPGAFERNLELVKQLERWAKTQNVTAAQMSLAWVLSRGEHVLSIPGTRSLHRLEENFGASDIQLTSMQLQAIDELVPLDSFVGHRLPEKSRALISD